MVSEAWVLVRRPALLRMLRAPRRDAVLATLVVADLLGALLAALLADGVAASVTTAVSRTYVSVVPLALCLMCALALMGAYSGRSAFESRNTVHRSRVGQGLVLTGASAWIMDAAHAATPSMHEVALWLVVTFPFIVALRSAGLRVVGTVRPRRGGVLGLGTPPAAVAARLSGRPELELVTTSGGPGHGRADWPDRLGALVRSERVDRVIVHGGDARCAVAALGVLPLSVDVTVLPGSLRLPGGQAVVEHVAGLGVVQTPLRRARLSGPVKRFFDIIVAASVLLLTAPFLVLVAVGIRCTSSGPIVFRQVRTGLGGRPFVMLKFRTMWENAAQMREGLLPFNQAEPPLFKLEPDPRSTRLGRHLRRTHLDELPQLLNVLRGDMSLVGPRPLPVGEAAVLAHAVPSRHD